MKILVIDDQAHKELGIELKKHEIALEHNEYITDETDQEAYSLVILCPKSIEDLRRMFDVLILRRMKPVVLYEKADDRFINFCSKLGCVDVVRKPYNPEMLAKRLVSVIESISSEETGGENRGNYEIQIGVEDFVKREIKNASRSQLPLGFIALGSADGGFPLDRAQNILDKLKQCLRDTDFAFVYGGRILVILHGCGGREINIVGRKLAVMAGDSDVYFYGFVKNNFLNKNPDKEFEEIISHLIKGHEEELIKMRLKQKVRGL